MTIPSGKARVAGVIGWPIAHSLSPRLHNCWIARYGIDGMYVPLGIRPEDVEAAMRLLPRMGFAGFNITAPHKQAAYFSVDERTPRAARMGAVNTVIVDADGRMTGDNTDGYGYIESLRQAVPTWRSSDGPAVDIGAGGGARGVVAALVNAGTKELRLINRNQSRAEVLAEELGGPIAVVPWDRRHAALEGAAFLVNVSSAGMTGNPPLDLDITSLPKSAVVSDIVYVPLATPLLIQARARGNPTVDGIGMLLHQARPGFHAWFGVDPAVDEDLRAFVLQAVAS